jgi:hypothetical protein
MSQDYCNKLPAGFKFYKPPFPKPPEEILRNKKIFFEIIKNSVDQESTLQNIRLFYNIIQNVDVDLHDVYYDAIDDGDTTLHAIIKQGNRDVLYHIFNKIFFYGQSDYVRYASKWSFSKKNKDGDIPLRLAIKLNFEVDYILDLYLCNMKLDDFVRVTSNPLPLIHSLVDRPGSINKIFNHYEKDAPHLVLLEKLGAFIQDEHGNAILHLLVNKPFTPNQDLEECFYMLLTMNLLTIQNEDGNTPVHLLYIHGYFHILKSVIEQSVNVFKLQNRDGNTLLHLLCMKGDDLLKDTLEYYQADEALDKQNQDKNTPLHLALLYMNTDVRKGINMASGILELLRENAPEMIPELLHMHNRDGLSLMDMITTKFTKEQERLTELQDSKREYVNKIFAYNMDVDIIELIEDIIGPIESITLLDILEFLNGAGVETVIAVDLSCSAFSYKNKLIANYRIIRKMRRTLGGKRKTLKKKKSL